MGTARGEGVIFVSYLPLDSLSFFTLQTNDRLRCNQRENCIRNHSKKMVRTLKRKELTDRMIEYRRGMITRHGRERQVEIKLPLPVRPLLPRYVRV